MRDYWIIGYLASGVIGYFVLRRTLSRMDIDGDEFWAGIVDQFLQRPVGAILLWPILLCAVAVLLLFEHRPVETPSLDESRGGRFFVFAQIQDPLMPIERVEKYEDPLLIALEAVALGEVVGGGTQLGEGSSVAWVGIDIELVNLDGALEFTREKLKELGAPPGSVLKFERDGENHEISIH